MVVFIFFRQNKQIDKENHNKQLLKITNGLKLIHSKTKLDDNDGKIALKTL